MRATRGEEVAYPGPGRTWSLAETQKRWLGCFGGFGFQGLKWRVLLKTNGPEEGPLAREERYYID